MRVCWVLQKNNMQIRITQFLWVEPLNSLGWTVMLTSSLPHCLLAMCQLWLGVAIALGISSIATFTLTHFKLDNYFWYWVACGHLLSGSKIQIEFFNSDWASVKHGYITSLFCVNPIVLYNGTQVSYSVTSNSADRYNKFYRSLPTDLLINYGRLILMGRFEWIRIGILFSADQGYVEVRTCVRLFLAIFVSLTLTKH